MPRDERHADGTAGPWPPGFDDLYTRRYVELVRVARLIVGRTDLAEELVQDSFIAVARRWHDVREPAAYLRRAVVNACTSHLRRRGRERAQLQVEVGELTRRVGEEPGIPADEQAVWRAVQQLSPRRRAALVLRYYEDLPDREIARILDCSTVTVRSLVRRGLAQLEEVL